MTRPETETAGIGGTGCSWSPAPGRAIRFASSDDRAVVKIRNRIVVLVPDVGAKDLAPFTFDRWRSAGLTVRVVENGPARRRGEAFVSQGTLQIVHPGERRVVTGTLDCGM